MPRKGGKLTPMERTWAERYAATGDATYAAEKAGYRQPALRGWENMNDPTVMEHATVLVRRKLENAAPAAVDRLVQNMNDPKVKPSDQNTAADKVLKHFREYSGAGGGKEPHEMTAEEIAATIDALKRVAADKARMIIDHEPVSDEGESDIFG